MKPGEAAIALAVIALGTYLAIATYLLPDVGGYAQVGPRVFPSIVAAGLLICGGLLMYEALHGGFSARVEEDVDPFDGRSFAWTSVGVLGQLLAVGVIGFILASTWLFAAVARAFGSRRTLRDVLVGLVLATALYLLFTEVLSLSLGPAFGRLRGSD